MSKQISNGMRPTHWPEDGNLRMIDVSDKNPSKREAKASGKILIKKETIKLIESGKTPKGDIFTTAKIAGINAVKQTQLLIPLCHNLNITHCDINFEMKNNSIEVKTTVRTHNRTGVEMEALTGTAVVLLTIYDMLKPVDKSMIITEIKLLEKTGGKSGHYKRE